MNFPSILFGIQSDYAAGSQPAAPAFFVDLNLDQIVDAVTAGWAEYDLKPFFHAPLHQADAIIYRQEVFQELEGEAVLECIRSFAQRMRSMRAHLDQMEKLHDQAQKDAWFLDAVEIYGDAVKALCNDLYRFPLRSRGLLAFRDFLTRYTASPQFASLVEETKSLKADLASVRYCVLIGESWFRVRRFESEPDYSADVEATFQKFKQGAVKDYKVTFSSWPTMNHIEAKILEFVAELYPDIFAHLAQYAVSRRDYLDATIAAFDREVHFYVSYLDHIAILKQAGLPFCYPLVSRQSKEVYAYDTFDLALARKLVTESSGVVLNDMHLSGKERIFVVTGPNQGGKTTFARTFGQLHYLASLGCPVPGRTAQLYLFDSIFTHFEKEEEVQTLRGKLQDDLIRVRDILREATSDSIVIMNEVFTSTTLQDAVFLSRKIMREISDLDLLCVWVTFIDELATFSEKTVSMVSMVVPDNPALRTFKVLRKPADGLAHAMSIAEKYGVTYQSLKDRLKS
jgi:DNA mismatch repair protein MutS